MFQILLRFFRFLRRGGQDQRAALLKIVSASVVLVVVSSAAFYHFEATADPDRAVTVADALWWSIVTMTTVGYGDLFPITWQGRWLVAAPTMVLGIGVMGYAIGLVTTLLFERADKRRRGMGTYDGADHIVLCHFPSAELITEVIDEIHVEADWRGRQFVLVSERLEELPQELVDRGVFFIRANPSREEALERAGIGRARAAMVFARDRRDLGSDNQSLGVVVTIHALAPELDMVVECVAAENLKLLRTAGASELVSVGELRAELMVQGLQDPGVNGVIAELVTNTAGHQFYVEPVRAFRGTYGELKSRLERDGVVTLGLVVAGERRFVPPDSTDVAPGHSLIAVGRDRPRGL